MSIFKWGNTDFGLGYAAGIIYGAISHQTLPSAVVAGAVVFGVHAGAEAVHKRRMVKAGTPIMDGPRFVITSDTDITPDEARRITDAIGQIG